MDVWINQRESGYMNVAKWAACGATVDNPYPNIKGRKVWVGVDLSSTTDLTSVTFLIEQDNDVLAIKSHSFIPYDKLEEKRKTDKVPYDLWVKQGWITATDGAEVNYHDVLTYIVSEYELNEWDKEEFCYDSALATWLKQTAEELGFVPIEIPQTFFKLSMPTKTFRAKTYNKKIIHNNDPVLSWAVGNAVVRVGPSENILLDKGKAKDRFDPLAAGINAMTRAIANEAQKPKGRVFFA
jgi:phage terminase large subunit-like protein